MIFNIESDEETEEEKPSVWDNLYNYIRECLQNEPDDWTGCQLRSLSDFTHYIYEERPDSSETRREKGFEMGRVSW